MKQLFFLLASGLLIATTACEKDVTNPSIPSNLPRTNVAAELKGPWLYGNFSLTDYWSTNPNTYIGNALENAIAFQFNEDGTYTHYFTSSYVLGGIRTYQQSVTKGTVEVNTAAQTIETHPHSAHYKRTRNNQVEEEKDLSKNDITSATTYTYRLGKEPNGTTALYLTMKGTSTPLTFLLKK